MRRRAAVVYVTAEVSQRRLALSLCVIDVAHAGAVAQVKANLHVIWMIRGHGLVLVLSDWTIQPISIVHGFLIRCKGFRGLWSYVLYDSDSY